LEKLVPTPTIITRQELHEWDRHVRGFRADHNFALSAGVTSGNWRVKSFGTIDERRFANSGLYSRFQYSFHLPIYHGFGYMLGSGAGYIYETADSRRPFKPVAAWQYPGVLAGLVLNMSSVLRWAVSIEAYLERHNGIEERDGREDDFDVHVTMQVYDVATYFDIFYDLGWAVRIEAHMRRAEFNRPEQPEDATPETRRETEKVDASITKEDQWLGVGLVYHLI
jgi:hypothetical protein